MIINIVNIITIITAGLLLNYILAVVCQLGTIITRI